MRLQSNEVFLPCAEEMGKRRDYRAVQEMLQIIRDQSYTNANLHDDIIENCIRQSGSDVEKVR